MLWLILALIASEVAMLLIGPRVLPVLRKLKFGQTIYELGPKSHRTKQGTPTMGGLMFAAVTVIVGLGAHADWLGMYDFAVALAAVSVLSMLIGFVDDYIKVVKKRNLGLIWWQKIVGQVVVSLAFSWYCYKSPLVGPAIVLPFGAGEWDLGLFYVPLMAVTMIFMINSANLQDGLDGLLSSVTVVGSAAWAGLALLAAAGGAAAVGQLENYQNLAVFAMALCGALIGFLRFNRYPAMVFMGDTGSMFIGGAMVGMAMLMRMPLHMLMLSFTPILSSLSVILQRVYFKLTHGKRIFKMSPIHHHFELCGMTEKQIVAMYTAVEVALCALALLTFGA